jgi:hypothetical protein
MNFFRTLAMVGLVGVGMVRIAVCQEIKKTISEGEAISIAQQWIQKNEPKIDISQRKPVAHFNKDAFITLDGIKTTGLWSVSFGIPGPSGHGCYILSLNRWGNMMGNPMIMSL